MKDSAARARRRRRQRRRRVAAWIAPTLGPLALRTLSRSWRLSVENREVLDQHDGTVGTLYAMWHGRMILGMPSHRADEFTILVSMSEDGGLAKQVLDWFGYSIIRGSSSRGGARALREMLTELRSGRRVVVTPDGPRGPRHAVNPGLAWMSRASGMPIVPIGMAADRAWRLSSWDACTIAKPFARVGIVYGDPIQVDRRADDEALEAATNRMRDSLIAAERRAFELVGADPDW